MNISCQFATSLRSAEHIATAEAMDYKRAWLFDTPAQSPDVWAMLALAAQQTRRIGLGPGVLVPTLRHPMVNASGAAMLSALAPGRVAAAFGTGFNGTRALGAPPATWSYLKSYVHTFRALLRGETVEWDRRPIRMLHPADHAPARPIELPVLISALGPKRLAIAREIADGLFSDATYEFGGDVTQLPGGQHWLKVINAQPEHERHLAVHDQHLVGLNQADDAAWAAGSWQAIPAPTVTGSPARSAEQLAHYTDQGITEIIYQPAGPDITGELERFITIAQQTKQTVQS